MEKVLHFVPQQCEDCWAWCLMKEGNPSITDSFITELHYQKMLGASHVTDSVLKKTLPSELRHYLGCRGFRLRVDVYASPL